MLAGVVLRVKILDGINPPDLVSFWGAHASSLHIDGEKSPFVFVKTLAFCATLSRGAGTQNISGQFWVFQATGDRWVSEVVIRINEEDRNRICLKLPALLIVPGNLPAICTLRMDVGDGKKTLAKGALQHHSHFEKVLISIVSLTSSDGNHGNTRFVL